MQALEKGERFKNFSKTYAENIVNEASVKAFNGIAEACIVHPTDRHPPLATRLEALKMTIEKVSESALNVNPADPAILLIESPEYKEEEISASYQSDLADRIGIDLDDAHKETE